MLYFFKVKIKKTSFNLNPETVRQFERKTNALRKLLGFKVSKTATLQMMIDAFDMHQHPASKFPSAKSL